MNRHIVLYENTVYKKRKVYPMLKTDILKKIMDVGVVAVVRAESSEQAIEIAKACIKGGLSAVEVTFTVPNATGVIESLAKAFKPSELIIGAGTVLDSETARIAILAGAKYIVSPAFDLSTAKLCNRYQIHRDGCTSFFGCNACKSC